MRSVPRYTQSRIVFFDWYSEELPCVLNMYIASYSRAIPSVSISDFSSTISAEEPLTYLEIFLGFLNILNSHSIQPHKRNSILYSAPYNLVRWNTANTKAYNIDSGFEYLTAVTLMNVTSSRYWWMPINTRRYGLKVTTQNSMYYCSFICVTSSRT